MEPIGIRCELRTINKFYALCWVTVGPKSLGVSYLRYDESRKRSVVRLETVSRSDVISCRECS